MHQNMIHASMHVHTGRLGPLAKVPHMWGCTTASSLVASSQLESTGTTCLVWHPLRIKPLCIVGPRRISLITAPNCTLNSRTGPSPA
jgi:hypothetical protein